MLLSVKRSSQWLSQLFFFLLDFSSLKMEIEFFDSFEFSKLSLFISSVFYLFLGNGISGYMSLLFYTLFRLLLNTRLLKVLSLSHFSWEIETKNKVIKLPPKGPLRILVSYDWLKLNLSLSSFSR